MATTDSKLMTAEEFFKLPDQGQPVELVRGRVVRMNVPGMRHGAICLNIGYALKRYLEDHDIGRAVCNDSGVITERDPDSVRGAEVAYYSYERIAREAELPAGYPSVSPDIAFEVLSPSNSWKDVLSKVSEYLNAGVLAVCIVDPQRQRAVLYFPDKPEESFAEDSDISFGDLLPGFSLPLDKLWK